MVSLYLRILHWILMHLASRGRVHVAHWSVDRIGFATSDVVGGLGQLGASWEEIGEVDADYLIVLPGRTTRTARNLGLLCHEMTHWAQDKLGYTGTTLQREVMAYRVQWLCTGWVLGDSYQDLLRDGLDHSMKW